MRHVSSLRLAAGAAWVGSGLALASWGAVLSGSWQAVAFGEGYLPMAPITAVILMLLGGSWLAQLLVPQKRAVRWGGGLVAVVVAVVGGLELLRHRPVQRLPWDGWLTDGGKAGGLPVGVMSPVTGALFLIFALALAVRRSERAQASGWRWAGDGLAVAGLATAAAVGLSYVAGAPLYYDRETVPMALLTAVVFGLFNFSYLVSGALGEHLRREWAVGAEGEMSSDVDWAFRRRLGGAMLLFFLVVGSVGFYFLRVRRGEAKAACEAQLDAVLELKTEELANWRRERLGEAKFLSGTQAVAEDVARLLASPRDPSAQERVRSWLAPIKGGRRYASVWLFDAAARPLQGVPEGLLVPPAVEIEGALARGEVVLVDWSPAARGASLDLHLVAPIFAPRAKASNPLATPIGGIVLSVDPRAELLPLLDSHAAGASSLETRLVWRDGDEVVSVGARGQVVGEEGKWPRSSGAEREPTAGAAGGEFGLRETWDYRGVAVLAKVRAVPESPWRLEAKIDRAEVEAPSVRETRQVSALGGALLLAGGFFVAAVWRHRRVTYLTRALQAEGQRNALAARFASVMEQANDIIILSDGEDRVVEANGRALAAYGYTLAELQQLSAGGLRAEASREEYLAQRKWYDSPEGTIYETIHRRKDGTTFPVEVSGRTLEIGGRRYKLGIYRDITQRKAHEAQIERLSRVYAALSHVNQAIVRATSRATLFEEICRILVQFGGFKMAWIGSEDPVTRTMAPVARFGDETGYLERARISADDREIGLGPTGTALREGRRYVCNDFFADPRTAPWREAAKAAGFAASLALPVRVDGPVVAVLTVYAAVRDFFGEKEIDLLEEAAQDLSFALANLSREARRVQAEADLMTAKQDFAKAFIASPTPVSVNSAADERFLDVNAAWEQLTGYRREEVVGRTPQEISAWADPRERDRVHELIAQDGRIRSLETRFLRKDGSAITCLLSAEIIGFGGQPCLLSTVVDITERKQSERRIREQAELIDKANEAIVVADLDNRITFWSRGAERISGWSAVEIVGKTVLEVFALGAVAVGPELEPFLGAISDWRGEIHGHDRHSRPLTIEASVTVLRDEAGRPTGRLGICSDVTEKKKLAAQFLRAQRLESIGMLAAGIAHDMNNVLAPISMAAPLLRNNITDARDLRLLETLEKCAERGAGLVRQILGFAHGVGGEPRLVQVKHLLRDIANVVTETFPKSIVLQDSVPTDLWPVLANPTHIHQVLLNLCVNARDAMPEGGTLRLRGENVVLDAAAAAGIEGARPGAWLVIHVEDTGTGIPPELLPRIWEPFFTTKTADKGTGLGLSTVRGIIETHQGFVVLTTAPGRGTTFRVHLPAAEYGQPGAATEPAARAIHGREELILLADDEEFIRHTVTAILKRHGYRVLAANDGGAALALFEKHAADIALVITDRDMPVMDGAGLTAAIRHLRPAVKILEMSGLGKGARPAAADAPAFIGKPFKVEELLAAVQQLLPAPATPPPGL